MSAFKFIHTADLHIESPYRGISRMDEALGKALVKNGERAYEKLIQSALDYQVDFVLIAGDCFDSESGSLSAQYRFVKGLERLKKADIAVYIITGNHDPLDTWSQYLKLPDNTILFGPDEVQQYTFFKGEKALAEIYGVSFGKKEEFRNLSQLFHGNDKAEFSIAMLHGTESNEKTHIPYCPFEMKDLVASGIDYWALGHIHKREVLSENNPMVVYPGNIQGRHFKESGEKGCSLVEVKDGHITNHQFISLSDVIFDYRELDLSGKEDISEFREVYAELREALLNKRKSYLLRLHLKGRTELHRMFANTQDVSDLISSLNQENDYRDHFVFIDRIVNGTTPEIDLEARKQSSDFIADIIRQFETIEGNKDVAEQLVEDLADEIFNTKIGRELKSLDFREELITRFPQLLQDAKWKCIDGLIKR